MKLPAFDYASPATLAEALALLAAGGGTAKPIAGGQSLLPMMAYRVAAPALLVDLRKLPDLNRIAIGADGVRLGAMVRWRDIEDDARLLRAHPLLLTAIGHVAHYQVRNRGTVGGSVAHADPAAELPGIAATCDAELTLAGPAGSRVVRASEFFLGPLSTALAEDELVVELHLPHRPAQRRWGFEEFARRRHDFAVAGIAVFYDPDDAGRAKNVHVGVFGACSRPHRLAPVEALLEGRSVEPALMQSAGKAAAEAVDPPEDFHASAAYRRALVSTLVERALQQASARTQDAKR
jgi:carbon-monoxide dehydrogenase medium subunit